MKKIQFQTLLSTLIISTMGTASLLNPIIVHAAPTVNTSISTEVVGNILLSVIPEIRISYNQQGQVVALEGTNDDGKALLANYTNYQGQECDDVVETLIEKMYKAGHFSHKVNGQHHNIILKLEKGSATLNDDFWEDIVEEVNDAISEHHLTSSPILVTENDFAADGKIDLAKAKELLLKQLGLTDVTFLEQDYDTDDNIYEFEFVVNNIKYEYEINAISGAIVDSDLDDDDDIYESSFGNHDDDKDDDHDEDHDDDHDDDHDEDDDDDD